MPDFLPAKDAKYLESEEILRGRPKPSNLPPEGQHLTSCFVASRGWGNESL